jgi:hypothetical protein
MANFANGILDVRVPKSALPQPKKIAIGLEGEGSSSKRADKRMEERAPSASNAAAASKSEIAVAR